MHQETPELCFSKRLTEAGITFLLHLHSTGVYSFPRGVVENPTPEHSKDESRGGRAQQEEERIMTTK